MAKDGIIFLLFPLRLTTVNFFFVICESRYISLDNVSVYSLFIGLYPLYRIYIGCNTYFQWLINQPKKSYCMYFVVTVTLIIILIIANT